MNFKRICGSILAVLGIASLGCTAMIFVSSPENNPIMNRFMTYELILGTTLLVLGIGLITATKYGS